MLSLYRQPHNHHNHQTMITTTEPTFSIVICEDHHDADGERIENMCCAYDPEDYTFDELNNLFDRDGYMLPSSSEPNARDWSSTVPEINYTTGATVTKSVHMRKGDATIWVELLKKYSL